VERSHGTDEIELYQLLTYTDDVGLNAKLGQWERHYNYQRAHGALSGKSPYEVLPEKLNFQKASSTEAQAITFDATQPMDQGKDHQSP